MTQPQIANGEAGSSVRGKLNRILVRTFNVLDYGAAGNGSTNDYAAFSAALTDIYTNKGGILEVPYTTNGYVLGTSLVIDVGTYSGGDGITVNLNGNKILPSHTGWCFDIATNFFGANNGGLLGRKQITLEGGGAIIITSNSAAAGGIRLNDSVGARISDLSVNGYAAGTAIQLFITTNDQSTWIEHCELNNIRGSGNLIGLYLKSSHINASFLGNVFRSVVFEGRVNNAKLFNIEGLLFDALFLNCGGYYNQLGATGGCGFYLNGGFCGGTFINPYIDGGGAGTQSALTDIVFGPLYTTTPQYFPTFVNVMEISLPYTWRDNLLVVGSHNITGVLSGNASGNPREMLRSARTYYVNASTGSDTTKDGLSSGNPFATAQHAIDVIYSTIDCGNRNITIQLADATYTTAAVVIGQPIGLGLATFTIQGTTAGGAVISTTSADAVTVKGMANVVFSNITFKTTTSGTGLKIDEKSKAVIGSGCKFDTCATQHIFCTGGSQLINTAGYTIIGNAPIHFNCSLGSLIGMFTGTIDATGRTFASNFAAVSENSVVGLGVTFTTTSTTGSRFYIQSGALIQTFGAGASYLPGSVAGFAETGQFAQYL